MRQLPFLALSLIVIGAAFRVLPHPWNFAPLGAIALYGGAHLGRRASFVVPFAALLISDAIIGWYNLAVMVAVYGSFALTVLIGHWVKRQQNLSRVLAGSLSGSLVFFVVTNAAVWAFGHGYQPTVAGLLQAYTNAIPFFRNTLLSDVFYTSIFFGVTAAAALWQRRAASQQTV